jgi:hypothetical protein
MSALRDELHRLINELSDEQATRILEFVQQLQYAPLKPDYDPAKDPAAGLLAEFAEHFPGDLSTNYEDYLYNDEDKSTSSSVSEIKQDRRG